MKGIYDLKPINSFGTNSQHHHSSRPPCPSPPYPPGNDGGVQHHQKWNYVQPWNVTRYVEQQLYNRKLWADRITLVNKDVVYRVLKQYMWQLIKLHDSQGYYIDVPPFGRYRFVETDPTTTIATLHGDHYWVPVI
jgi:hypothetical protein